MLQSLYVVFQVACLCLLCAPLLQSRDIAGTDIQKGLSAATPQISAALKRHLLETTSWIDSEIEVNSIGNPNGVELPAGNYEFRLLPGTTAIGRNRVQAHFEAIQGGKTLRDFWVTADVSIRASILTASRKIPYNRALSFEDINESKIDIPDFRSSYPRKPGDLVGKISRRSFSPGSPLPADAFAEPFLVRHGDTVQLRLERNGIVLTAVGKAEQDGRLGQFISVRNLQFSTSLKAQVTAPGVVRIQ